MGANPAYIKFQGVNNPVDTVSWDDAQEFIRRLNQLSGKLYRLPTEANGNMPLGQVPLLPIVMEKSSIRRWSITIPLKPMNNLEKQQWLSIPCILICGVCTMSMVMFGNGVPITIMTVIN